jgi:hypothetical protein
MDARPRRAGGLRVTLRTTCRCRYRGRLVVSDGDKVLARGRVDLPRARHGVPIRATVTLALTRAGARAARPGTEATVTFTSKRVTTPPFRTRLAGR